jgi:hypothetical protein
MELYTAAGQRWTYICVTARSLHGDTGTIHTLAASPLESPLAIESLLYSLLESLHDSLFDSLLERVALRAE